MRQRVVVHGVDGVVAPRRVLNLRAPDVVAQDPAAGIDHVGLVLRRPTCSLAGCHFLVGRSRVQVRTEGRDLDRLVLAAAAEDHVHQTEAAADDESAAEVRLHLLGRGVGGHVPVLGPQPDQQVTHGATYDVGLVPGVLQRLHDAHRVRVEQAGVDAVFGLRHLDPRAQRHHGNRCLRRRTVYGRSLAQQAVDEFLDHGWNRFSTGQCRSCATRRSEGPGLVATG